MVSAALKQYRDCLHDGIDCRGANDDANQNHATETVEQVVAILIIPNQ